MEKIICALWKSDDESHASFNARLLSDVPAKLAQLGAQSIRLNIEEVRTAPAAPLRQSRGAQQHAALLQYWLPSAHPIFRAKIDALLDTFVARWAGWIVLESTILPNRDHPPASGARNWGWAQIACLTLPNGMAHEDWRRIWQDDHTQVAVETQANFEYVQNLIIRPLTPDAPPYVAIVEECFPDAAMTDAFAFFDAVGDKAKFAVHLERMMTSCNRFITPGTIDVIPTSQYNF
jgi:hypothetical protein